MRQRLANAAASANARALERDQAQRVLRKFFLNVVRTKGTKYVAERFLALGLTLSSAKGMEYDELTNRLKQQCVLDVSADLLLRIIQASLSHCFFGLSDHEN